jgi:hypothetical protein
MLSQNSLCSQPAACLGSPLVCSIHIGVCTCNSICSAGIYPHPFCIAQSMRVAHCHDAVLIKFQSVVIVEPIPNLYSCAGTDGSNPPGYLGV